ncbi:MAG TPA: hypothetical protein VGD48_35755 [Kutzneria sp.]
MQGKALAQLKGQARESYRRALPILAALESPDVDQVNAQLGD